MPLPSRLRDVYIQRIVGTIGRLWDKHDVAELASAVLQAFVSYMSQLFRQIVLVAEEGLGSVSAEYSKRGHSRAYRPRHHLHLVVLQDSERHDGVSAGKVCDGDVETSVVSCDLKSST